MAVRTFQVVLLFIAVALLNTSCFVRTNRVYFKYQTPLEVKHTELKKDSLRFLFTINPNTRNIVLPLFAFKGNKKKASIRYRLYGKSLSGREYTIAYKNLEIKDGETVIGRSKDPDLFKDLVEYKVPKDAVSALYGTPYILKIKAPSKKNLTVHIEFEIKNKAGMSEEYTFDVPLETVHEKSFKLLNILK